jgi:hypothetical protein
MGTIADIVQGVLYLETARQTKNYDAPPSNDDLIAFVKPFVQP